MWLVVVIQLAVPLLLTGSIAMQRQPSRLRWLTTLVTFGMVITYLLISMRWDVSSLYLRAVFPVLFVAASFVGYRRIRETKKTGKLQVAVYWTTSLATGA